MESKQKSHLTIRYAVEADLRQAGQIWNERAALLQQTENMPPLKPPQPRAWQRQAQTWLKTAHCGFFVGEAKQLVCGYMVVKICAGPAGLQPATIGKVIDMAVDLHQSQPGLAGDLLDAARQWLLVRDIAYLTVDVPAAYPVEEAFWRAQGARLRYKQNWLALYK